MHRISCNIRSTIGVAISRTGTPVTFSPNNMRRCCSKHHRELMQPLLNRTDLPYVPDDKATGTVTAIKMSHIYSNVMRRPDRSLSVVTADVSI